MMCCRFNGALASLLICWGAVAQPAQDQAALQVKLEQVGREMASLQADLAAAEGKRGQLLEQLRLSETELGTLTARMRSADSQIAAQQARIEVLEQERSQAAEHLSEQVQALNHQLKMAYAIGRQGRLKLLLQQQGVHAWGRVLAYYRYLSGAQRRELEALRAAASQLDQAMVTLHAAEEALRLSRGRLTEQQRRLERQRQQRLHLVAQLQDQARSQRGRLQTLQQDRAHLERLLGALRDVFADIPAELGANPAFAALRGRLSWPLSGRMLLSPGQAKPAGMDQAGALIAAPASTEVHAISYGRVAFADWLRGFGLLVILDHGEGYMSLYGFNDALYVETGDWVSAGQVISVVGVSGGLAAPQLYFELRQAGQPIDLRQWLAPLNPD